MLGRLRVLIVDDHPGVVKAISRLLAFDYQVVGGLHHGKDLLATAQSLCADVVVLDVNLPDIDGISACRHITEADARIRVVIFTADARPEARQRALEAGAFAFVGKNEPSDNLLATMRRVDEARRDSTIADAEVPHSQRQL